MGINVRTSHFGVNATRYCFFCTKDRNFNTDKSFLNLFFDCPTVRRWHDSFIDKFIKPGGIPNITDKKKFLFTGVLNNDFNYFEASAAITFQFSIWEEKLRKKLPSYHTIKNSFIERFFGAVKTVPNCVKQQQNLISHCAGIVWQPAPPGKMMDQDGAGGGNPDNTSTRAAAAEKNCLLAAEKIKAAFKAAKAVSTGSAPTTGAATPSPLDLLSQANVPIPPPKSGSTFSLSHEGSAIGASSLPPLRGVTMRL